MLNKEIQDEYEKKESKNSQKIQHEKWKLAVQLFPAASTVV